MCWKLLTAVRNVSRYVPKISHSPTKSFKQYTGKEEAFVEKVKSFFLSLYKIKISDKVPHEYRMVYRSSIESSVDYSILTGAVSIVFLPIISPYIWESIQESGWSWTKVETLGFFLGIYGPMMFLYTICLRCPQRMYYSESKNHFLVYMPRAFPYLTKTVILNPGTVKPSPSAIGQYLPWKSLEHSAEGLKQKIIILEHSFSPPIYYLRLLKGFEKGLKNPTNPTNKPRL